MRLPTLEGEEDSGLRLRKAGHAHQERESQQGERHGRYLRPVHGSPRACWETEEEEEEFRKRGA